MVFQCIYVVDKGMLFFIEESQLINAKGTIRNPPENNKSSSEHQWLLITGGEMFMENFVMGKSDT